LFIKVPNMTVMAASPRDPYVAVFTPDQGNNQGAHIDLIDVSNGKTLRTHTLFNKPTACTFYWHPEGRYLAAQVDSYIKGKRLVSCLTLFRTGERGTPTQTIDEATQRITTFSWEPGLGTRFAYSSTDAPETSITFKRTGNVSIYDMRGYGSTATRVRVLEKKPSTKLSWAPQQGILLLCDLSSSQALIEFYDVTSNTTLESTQLFSPSSIEWDPSGRFVAFVASCAVRTGGGDCGYAIYTFTGRLLYRFLEMSLSHFVWRPRPVGVLDSKKMDSLRKDLPKFRKEFQKEEQKEIDRHAQDAAKKLQAVSDEFQKYMQNLLAIYDKEAGKLRQLSNGFDPKDPERFIVEKTVLEVPMEA